MNALVAFSTCPDAACAARIAEALVAEGLAACVNRVPGIASTYRWRGAVHTDTEVLLIIKTDTTRWAALEARLLALHPYAVPELIAWPASHAHPTYLDWLLGAPPRNQGDANQS